MVREDRGAQTKDGSDRRAGVLVSRRPLNGDKIRGSQKKHDPERARSWYRVAMMPKADPRLYVLIRMLPG